MSTILVDVDGVVANTHKNWISLYNGDYDDNLLYSDITDWDITKFVKPECGSKIYDYLTRPDFYDYVVPIDGASWGVAALRKLGHKVIFVSAGFYPAKIEWLHRWRFLKEYPYNDERWQTAADVVICHDKNLIKGDILIDDRLENAQSFGVEKIGYTKSGAMFANRGILFNQPWNKDRPFTAGLYWGFRVNNWPEIVRWAESGIRIDSEGNIEWLKTTQ